MRGGYRYQLHFAGPGHDPADQCSGLYRKPEHTLLIEGWGVRITSVRSGSLNSLIAPLFGSSLPT